MLTQSVRHALPLLVLVASLAPCGATAGDKVEFHACALLTAGEIEADFGFKPARSSERETTSPSGPLAGMTASVCVWELDAIKVSVIVRPASVPDDRADRLARQQARADQYRASHSAVEKASAGNASCFIARPPEADAPASISCFADWKKSSFSIDAWGLPKSIEMLTLMRVVDRIVARLR